MRLKALSVAGQRDVDEILVVSKVFEGGGDTTLVVVPAQAEVLGVRGVCHGCIYITVERNINVLVELT